MNNLAAVDPDQLSTLCPRYRIKSLNDDVAGQDNTEEGPLLLTGDLRRLDAD
jgi:hypothetical protein